MNKYLYILGLAGTALLSACSSDDLTKVPSPEDERAIIVEASRDSDVPITLGIGQSRGDTRAPLVPGEGGVFTSNNLAVFCLSTGTQTNVSNIPSTIKKNNWSKDKEGELGGLLVRMNNVDASVASGSVTYGAGNYYYYPMGNWMKYNFYAYYPKQTNEANVLFSENQVAVRFTETDGLDGTKDIIWGRAYPETNPDPATDHDPYCADYFRFNTTSEGPQFKFEHKLVQFKFFVKAAGQAVGAKVTDMYISNAIKQLTLIVANKNDTTKNGRVTPATSKTGKLNIKKLADDQDRFDGTDANALTLKASEQEVGYLMLPAPPNLSGPESAGFKYQISVTVKFTDDSTQDISFDMIPKTQIPGSDPAEYGFEPGKIYKILITIDKD